METILKQHSTKPKELSKQEQKDYDEKAKILVEELRASGCKEQPPKYETSAQQQKKRGRPPGKSPKRTTTPEPQQKISAKEAVQQIGKEKIITKLHAYATYFPELLGNMLNQVDIESASVQDLIDLTAVCKQTVASTLQIHTAPNMIENMIDSIEASILKIAIESQDENLAHLRKLRGVALAIKSDPTIAADIKLISIDLLDYLPSNPYIRLGMNIAKVAYGVFMYNSSKEFNYTENRVDNEKYSEF